MIWSRDDVRRAAGPIDKPAKAKRGKQDLAPIPAAPEPVAAPIAETAPEKPVERVEAVSAPQPYPEPVEALSAPQDANGEAFDPVAALLARVEALEARVEALPQDTVATPTAVAERPRRTTAHERAIRRAWAERRAFRMQRDLAGQVKAELKAAWAVQEEIAAERDAIKASHDEWEALQHRTWTESMGHKAKRRRAVILARERGKRLEAEHRLVDRANERRRAVEQRADVLRAELAKLRADLADPEQPERASDIARLVRERDEARTALAAVDARNRALQSAVDGLADKFEGMVSRVTRAEAAMRAAGVQADGATRVA